MTHALAVRRCDPFLRGQACLLGSYGYVPDPGQVVYASMDELDPGSIDRISRDAVDAFLRAYGPQD